MESKKDCSSVPTSSSGWNPVKNNWRLCTLDKRVADAYLLLQIINICSPHAAKQLLAPCCGNLQVNGLHCTMQVLTLQVLTYKYWLTSTDCKYWRPPPVQPPSVEVQRARPPTSTLKWIAQIPTTIEATSPPGQLCVTVDLSTILHSTLKTFPLTTVYYRPLEVATSPTLLSLGKRSPLITIATRLMYAPWSPDDKVRERPFRYLARLSALG